MRIAIAVLFGLALSFQVMAATIRVPQDQATIQAGINAAVDGDTVLVSTGTYSENMTVTGKGLAILSESGMNQTTLVPQNPVGNVLRFLSIDGKECTVKGFTFTGSSGASCIDSRVGHLMISENRFVDNVVGQEGAIVIVGRATIQMNEFANNIGSDHGGAIRLAARGGTQSIIEDNVFRNNSARYGGAVDLLASDMALIQHNLFVGNSATEFGGAIYLGGSSEIKIINNTIDSCISLNGTGGGISFYVCENDTALNNIIANCQGTGVWQSGSSYYYLAYNDCFANLPSHYSGLPPGPGSMSVDPNLVGGTPFDYHLQGSSPCIDAGDPSLIYNDSDGSRNDIGALPYGPLGYPYAGWINYGPDSDENVIHTPVPTIFWSYVDTTASVQSGYEIEIGSDTNWVAAEMWQPGPQMSPDTSTSYEGSPLLDHHLYYLRLRVNNGLAWGEWRYSSFSSAISQTVRVPQDQPTIQAGINVTVDGDTVLVAPGTYLEEISVSGKSVTIISTNGPEVTSLNSTSKVLFSNCMNSTIQGFRFLSGGIRAHSAGNCQVINCRFLDVGASGFLIYGDGSSVVRVYRCLIARYDDLSIFTNGPNCEVINNTLDGNNRGLAVYGPNSIIKNNIIVNMGEYGVYDTDPSTILDYNDFWNNNPNYGGSETPGAHDIQLNPLFVNPSSGDYSLSQNSPCIDTGDPDPGYNDPDGSRNDMGAFPFISPDTRREVPQEYPTIQSAIDAAVDGDTVLVDDGHYYERISFLGKKIVVASKYLLDSDTLHIYQTIIDGDTAFAPLVSDTGSVVRFVNNEDSTSILEGFTVQNGTGTGKLGSGILTSSFPRLSRNRIVDNDNAGIYASAAGNDAPLSISGCFIGMNQAEGIYCNHNVAVSMESTRIVNNSGSGLLCYYWNSIHDCIIQGNIGSGIEVTYKSQKEGSVDRALNAISNVIFRNNTFGMTFNDKVFSFDSCLFEGNSSYAIGIGLDSKATVTNSIIRNNGDGTGNGGGLRFISDQVWGIDCSNTLFEGNKAEYGGAIGQSRWSELTLTNCTFVNNSADSGSAIYQSYRVRKDAILDMCVFSANTGGPVIFRSPSPDTSSWGDTLKMVFSCTNIFGNEEGDWIDSLAPQFGVNGNVSANPLFCDTASSDYRIKDSSPCAPANNSCGVLIGAYGIGCANVAPVLTSGDSAQTVSGLGSVYKATSTDIDGPATAYSFINRPSWLTASGDSVFGAPPLTDIDTSFMVVVSDGFLADSMIVTVEITESPAISALTTEGVAVAMNVISHTPTFGWQYFDATGSYPQTQFEIGVGSDSDWTYSELWNPAPFNGDATSKQYAGAVLVDGQTFWVRVRVRNALLWSTWKQTSFRMNSIPTTPEQLLPLPGANTVTAQPTFVIHNSFDAEVDSLYYTFEVSLDTVMSAAHSFTKKQDLDSLTSATIDIVLDENTRYSWRVRASDYFEESSWSAVRSFWVNTANSAPAAFALTSPSNTFSPPIATRTPMLGWTEAVDIDPLDAVFYTLHLALDSSFAFVNVIPGITSNQYMPPSPLTWGTRYWWKVKAHDLNGGETWSNQAFRFRTMALGDADGSGIVTISDVVFLINYIFSGGPAPNPPLSGDADCSGAISISDAVYLIQYIFGGGAPPCEG